MAASSGPTETVLLVDNDEGFRHVAKRVLERAGYKVLVASTVEEAMVFARSHKTIHLLLTDIVIGDATGLQLASRFEIVHPTSKVLFVSGHTDEVLHRRGVHPTRLLRKPLSTEELAAGVRSALDAR